MARTTLLLLWMAIAVVASGCTLITDVDRSLIGQAGGGSGGAPADGSAPDSSAPEGGTSAGGSDAGN